LLAHAFQRGPRIKQNAAPALDINQQLLVIDFHSQEISMDPTKRFSDKAQVYTRYRQDFAPEAIAALLAATGLARTATVLDVGAGIGMLTRHLLAHFDCAYALEPNREMRQASKTALGAFPGFHSLAARAEEIPLSASSVDLIAAGRVLHWLQPEPTRAEFRRLANRAPGWRSSG
jgi:SAM-dependent methyltransferase